VEVFSKSKGILRRNALGNEELVRDLVEY